MIRAFHGQFLGVVAVVAATVAACGGGPDQPSPSPATTPAPPATATATASPPPTPTTAPSPRATATATPSPSPTTTPTTPSPTPVVPEATAFRYDTYDTTGAVSTPGSYAFLSDPDDTTTAVATYEALRDGTATALLIHKSDADGASRADVYDAVETGDLFEWHKADDCFIRYTVTEVTPDPAGNVPRKLLAVEWMTYAFTGCSGAVPSDLSASLAWGELPDLGGPSLTAPVMHGAFQLVPHGWDGEVRNYKTYDPPGDARAKPVVQEEFPSQEVLDALPYYSEPDLPAGWRLTFVSSGTKSDPELGYNATYGPTTGGIGLGITGHFYGMRGIPQGTAYLGGVVETRVIDDRIMLVAYSPPGPDHDPRFHTQIWVFDSESESGYNLIAYSDSLRDLDVLMGIARSLFTLAPPATSAETTPTAEPAATTFRYDTYDTTGAVSTPGSHAFLSDPDDTSTVVTTYEALRDGTATALLVHTSDADGVSRADVYDAVEVGDLFEWHEADDCFVRYLVTEVKPDPTGAVPRKALVVQWTIYAFTGCGESIASSPVSIIWGPQPALGGDTLTVPVMVGIHQLVPENWTGAVRDIAHEAAPGGSHLIQQANPSTAVLSELDYWREPKIPEGWSLAYISAGTSSDPYQGFSAIYSPTEGIGISLEFHGYFLSHRNWQVPSGSTSSGVVVEARVIAGRPALIEYSPPGDSNDAYRPTTISIMDLATESGYTLTAYDSTLKNIDTLIAIASSLFAEPPPGGE